MTALRACITGVAEDTRAAMRALASDNSSLSARVVTLEKALAFHYNNSL